MKLRQRTTGRLIGRRLNQTELAAYDVLDPWQLAKVRVFTVPFIPGGYSGITIGNWIALATEVDEDGSSVLLAHELVHVHQWRDLGPARFTSQYLGSFAKNLASARSWRAAYLAIPAEKQARYQAGEWAKHRKAHSDEP